VADWLLPARFTVSYFHIVKLTLKQILALA